MVDQGMVQVLNEKYLRKAVSGRRALQENLVRPEAIVTLEQKEDGSAAVIKREEPGRMRKIPLSSGGRLILDFGDHQVGYVTLRFSLQRGPQDSPAYIRLKFGEDAREILERSEDYHGWISRSWIQEEYLHIDILPAAVELPRRYAFRYMELEVIDTSRKWELVLEDAECRAVSAVKEQEEAGAYAELSLLAGELVGKAACEGHGESAGNLVHGECGERAGRAVHEEREERAGKAVHEAAREPDVEKMRREMEQICRVSLRTLKNCMQDVFEDGPKRDRRLWLGDLRLQALSDYASFKNYDLVKRCLYLFAGMTRQDGKISACLFVEPEHQADNTFLFDYSLFFISTLKDYYEETKDKATLEDLWEPAKAQLEIAAREFDESGWIRKDTVYGSFIDWKDGLDKQSCSQAVYIFAAKDLRRIADILGKQTNAEWLDREIREKENAAWSYAWDAQKGLFVSGPARQISYATQVWMILAGVPDVKEGQQILARLEMEEQAVGMGTPYMNHHYVEALFLCGEKEKAVRHILYYWGGMVRQGADTFWEVYDPEDPQGSPYGSSIVNSYCHAWSCTPIYFIRKYGRGTKGQE